MWCSDVDTAYTETSHPKGGVAPLRHDLASHDHVRSRRAMAEECQRVLRPRMPKLGLERGVKILAAWLRRAGDMPAVRRRALP